jgi:hypothetical protein
MRPRPLHCKKQGFEQAGPMQYSAHVPFVAPARVRPELWRLIVGLVLTAIIYALGVAAIFGLVVAWSGIEGARSWMQELSGSAGPTGTLLLLATFVGMALGPMLAVTFAPWPLGSVALRCRRQRCCAISS